jgi:hypothetical protein
MNNFAELLKSLQATADEQGPAADEGGDDETIAAAAADSGVAADGNPEGDADADDAASADGKPAMAKSMTATGADGEEVEVVDATEMLKSLQDGLNAQGDVLAKALSTMTTAMQKQGEVIKSLHAKVEALSSQGRGRKTVVSVVERPAPAGTMAKSTEADAGVTSQEFMAKCLSAQAAGKLTAFDVSRAEVAINNGVAVPADIVSAVSRIQ